VHQCLTEWLKFNKEADKIIPTYNKVPNRKSGISEMMWYFKKIDPEGWRLIENGSKLVNFTKGQIVIPQGVQTRRLYQLVSGKCAQVDSKTRQPTQIFGIDDCYFGETIFVQNTTITNSIVVALEDSVVRVVEAYYLNILFQLYPSLGGKCFHFLSGLLTHRIMKHAYGEEWHKL